MTELVAYSYDTHLRMEDEELFLHSDRSWKRKHHQARQDIVRDLRRHGVEYGADDLKDDFAYAAVTLTFTATDDGSLVVPEGTLVRDVASTQHTNGAVEFATDEALTVSAGESDTVIATAVLPGEPGNVEAGVLTVLSDTAPSNFSAVTNALGASGGVDNQLTRACVYRALQMVYMDLMRTTGDAYDTRRVLYQTAYKEEVGRMIAEGLEWEGSVEDITGLSEPKRTRGYKRLERG